MPLNIAAVLIACGLSLSANESVERPGGARIGDQIPTATERLPRTPTTSILSMLRVQQVRLEAPPAEVVSPAALLKFDMVNAGPVPLTGITLRISVWEKTDASPSVVRVPEFDIRGEALLDSGYTLAMNILLRNLPVECACTARVEVVSVRALAR